MPQADIDIIHKFIADNEYDTESIIGDLMGVSQQFNEMQISSNIGVHLVSQNKPYQFVALRQMLKKYTDSQTDKNKLCNINNVLNVAKCAHVATIINALSVHDEENINALNNLNIANVLDAYDHAIIVHGLCSTSVEDVDEDDDVNDIQKYITKQFDGYCVSNKCAILKKHMMRGRRRQSGIRKIIDDKDHEESTLNEILVDTLNALHCYILHEKKQLFRLRENEDEENNIINSHFINDLDANENELNNSSHEQKSIAPNINFGLSVLKWLDYGEHPQYDDFDQEIVQNDQSTINTILYLNFKQECYLKMVTSGKHHQYLLKELLALKIYTDTNEYQSSLRRSFWTSTPKETRKTFYQWAMLLHKTSIFHAIPIPRWTIESNLPLKLYHGLNRVLVSKNHRPKYHGPFSCSYDQSVAFSFANGTGLLWHIKSSYCNKFKFLTGISVDWISQHKNEMEILLMDQYLPISATTNFSDDIPNNVDHFLHSVKAYQKPILDSRKFYNILGITFIPPWIPLIKKAKILFDTTDLPNTSKTVLERLVEELQLHGLTDIYSLFTAQYVQEIHPAFNLCSFRLVMTNEDSNCKFQGTECKLISG
eukprot:334175_1